MNTHVVIELLQSFELQSFELVSFMLLWETSFYFQEVPHISNQICFFQGKLVSFTIISHIWKMKRTVRPILVFKGQHHFVERNHTLFRGRNFKTIVFWKVCCTCKSQYMVQSFKKWQCVPKTKRVSYKHHCFNTLQLLNEYSIASLAEFISFSMQPIRKDC